MKETELRKADEYFNAKYGDSYTNSGRLFDFGFSNLPRVIQYSNDLSSDAKVCYAAMIDLKINNDLPRPSMYYPSQKRIVLLAGLRRQYVNRAMRELEKAELIGKQRRGLGKQNVYCLLEPPQCFVDEAIRTRVIIKLIKDGELSWDDVSDTGEAANDIAKARIDATKSIMMLDVTNNGHQDVTNNGHQDVNRQNTYDIRELHSQEHCAEGGSSDLRKVQSR